MKGLLAHEGCLGKVAIQMISHVAPLTEKSMMPEETLPARCEQGQELLMMSTQRDQD